MSNLNVIETDAGLIPSTKEIGYDITTQQIQEYLQAKLDDLARMDDSVPKVQIRVATSESYGRKFFPLFISLPKSVVAESRRTQNIPSLFRDGSIKESPMLNPVIYKFLSIYSYGNTNFNDDQIRRELGLSRQAGGRLNRYRNPQEMENKVILMIDPIIVFYRMLSWKNDNRPYHINVDKVIKQKEGIYRYHVVRSINNNNNKKKKNGNMDSAISKILG